MFDTNELKAKVIRDSQGNFKVVTPQEELSLALESLKKEVNIIKKQMREVKVLYNMLEELGYAKKLSRIKEKPLTEQEERVLSFLKEAKKQTEIARLMRLSKQRVCDIVRNIGKKGHRNYYPIAMSKLAELERDSEAQKEVY